jgi:hypothetical protein
VSEPAAPAPPAEFVLDAGARPGDVVVPLARLLIDLAAAEEGGASRPDAGLLAAG